MTILNINKDSKRLCLESTKRFVWVAVVIGLIMLSSILVSGSISEVSKILASDIQAGDYFGYSVSISSDSNTTIVGAYQEDIGGSQAGAAYIFRWDGITWIQEDKILASDKNVLDYFGYSVSISSDGNTAIVGAYGEDTGGADAGAAYIFTRLGSTWTEQQKIQASDIQAGDWFGYSVSISSDGNTALVGSRLEDGGGTISTGAAYIFKRDGTTWTQQAKILASDRQQSDCFGHSVSISSDSNTAIVGAYHEDTKGNSAGSAYIFRWNGTTWIEDAQIFASDAAANDYFGYSVSISSDGNTTIVGSYCEDFVGANDAGAAYIFRWDGTTWIEYKIQAGDIWTADRFGWSVSISFDGNTTLIGSYLEDAGATDAGAAYIFKWSGTTWTQYAKILASDAGVNDRFGHSVSISSDGSTAIVGANREDAGGIDAGAAYIFKDEIIDPNYSNFTSEETTNFLAEDVANVINLTLAITNKGKINFPSTYSINADNEDYDQNVKIEDAMIYVNTTALHSSFNSSATLTFYNVDCDNPYVFYSETASAFTSILSENQRCLEPLCSNITCEESTLTVDVAHFTGYAAGTNANLTIEAEAGIKYISDPIEFYAWYINSTDGTPISGECNISFDDNWGTWFEMDYNGSEYNYTKSSGFTTATTHYYNVTCSNANFVTLEAEDSKVVSPTDIPEFSVLTLGLGLIAVLGGLVVIRKRR
ncbi:MAG: hypothetical protein U9R34_02925 [Nanoarchaeota archaeon]|nr:hypothetical protein [Nanoarchaeota archaeon]